MKRITYNKMENLTGGVNRTSCYAAGIGIFAIAGPAWIIGVASAAYAVKCWNS